MAAGIRSIAKQFLLDGYGTFQGNGRVMRMNFAQNLLLESVYRHGKRKTLEDEGKEERLKKAIVRELLAVKRKVSQEAERGILFGLLLGMAEKKSRIICGAESLSQLAEMVKPCIPYWNGGEFRPGKYHVLEEELLIWSELSLEVVLNEDGYKRYEQLFTELFPEGAEKIFGKK